MGRQERRREQAALEREHATQQQQRQEEHEPKLPPTDPNYCPQSKDGRHDFTMGRARLCWWCGRGRS